MEVINENKRIGYLDCLRVIATVEVVLVHVVANQWNILDIDTFEWKVLTIYDAMARTAVPIFVMISGALFLGEKKIKIKSIYKKYIFRIIMAFIFWSAIYAGISMTHYDCEIRDGILFFIKGHSHMGFMFMIVGLYMLIPLLRKVAESEKMLQYYLSLALVFTFILPQCFLMISMRFDVLGAVFNGMLDSMSFYFTSGYVSYFMAGYYLNKIPTCGRIKWLIYFLGMIGFFWTISLTFWGSQIVRKPDETFWGSFTINVMLQSVAIYVFVKNTYKKMKIGKGLSGIIRKLAEYSFGVYLVHMLVIEFVERGMGVHVLSFAPLISVPMITAMVAIISWGISMILNKTPILKKYIV